ncbi:hypothetical protein XFF6166_590101 [Xanthomonas citri pv. fuscans]|nr:hypothetical protein XFF6166_590101 [Xanthomonas citri pv. fuscans]SOO00808.1 hypothetical protein XFF6960_370100 [Xanthomonas citri pv. fuscans]SOO06464.1 hypothetical protein XFF7767_700101 [Xanthomonas citri pv. fuscans]SOO10974.1 hypothetical protein XFF6970_690036 [Xanthomonas citri pv. fuscans]SOO43516.1 hypothetical protein XFF1815_390037 [Xanthomonas citri pv. fuscans]
MRQQWEVMVANAADTSLAAMTCARARVSALRMAVAASGVHAAPDRHDNAAFWWRFAPRVGVSQWQPPSAHSATWA